MYKVNTFVYNPIPLLLPSLNWRNNGTTAIVNVLELTN